MYMYSRFPLCVVAESVYVTLWDSVEFMMLVISRSVVSKKVGFLTINKEAGTTPLL